MINANLSAFSVGKAVGRGNATIPLQWANDNSRPYIAYQGGANIYFLVPVASSSTSVIWQYKQNGTSTWVNMSGSPAIITPATPFTFNGTTYQHYSRSPAWVAGNTNYDQKCLGAAEAGTSLGETIALANNAGNYP